MGQKSDSIDLPKKAEQDTRPRKPLRRTHGEMHTVYPWLRMIFFFNNIENIEMFYHSHRKQYSQLCL